MKKEECTIGQKVFYMGEEVVYGIIYKLKPIVAVLEVYDPITGDVEIHEISYNRLRRLD